MGEFFSKFDSGQLIGLAGLIATATCGIVGMLYAFFWQSQVTRRADINAALKQDMLNRGMSAEDIRTVLDAGFKTDPKDEVRRIHA